MEEQQLCKQCGKKLVGRSDKRFCDDACRNSYNNLLNSDENNYVRNINNALRKNRRILKNMLPEGEEMIKVTKFKMVNEGFSFHYFTHIYTTQKQQRYYFVYEYGYLNISEEQVLIVKRDK